jgi:predicted Rossmann-fold nucleotide-binding protein
MIVGVMASGKAAIAAEHNALAETVGDVIAREGFDLLTGGGQGLMKTAGQAFKTVNQRTGKLISVLRAKKQNHLTGSWDDNGTLNNAQVPRTPGTKRHWSAKENNELAEIVIRTHLPYSGELGDHDLSRNHINILTSDLIVILPGGSGTLSELKLANEYGSRIMIFLGKAGKIDEKSFVDLLRWLNGGKQVPNPTETFPKITQGESRKELKDWLRLQRDEIEAEGR